MRAIALLSTVAALAGCKGQLNITCDTDDFCVRGGKSGRCVSAGLNKYCAFADSSCGGGLRWDPTAGEGLGGTCYSVVSDGGVGDMAATGIKWSSLNSTAQDAFYNVMGAGGTLYAVGIDGIYKSTDGTSWKNVSPPVGDGGSAPAWYAVWVTSANEAVAVGEAGALARTSDGGANWTMPFTGTSGNLNAIWGVSASELFVGGDTGFVLHSTNGGQSWTVGNYDANNNGWDLLGVWASSATDVYYAGADGTIVRTTDGNKTFTQQTSTTQADLEHIWGSGPNDIWAVGTEQVVLHWDGTGWKTTATLGQPGSGLFGLWGFAADDIYAVGADPNLEASAYHYNGNTWSPVSLDGQYPRLWGVWGTGPRDVYIVAAQGVILHGK